METHYKVHRYTPLSLASERGAEDDDDPSLLAASRSGVESRVHSNASALHLTSRSWATSASHPFSLGLSCAVVVVERFERRVRAEGGDRRFRCEEFFLSPCVLGQLRGQGQPDRVEVLGRERERLVAAFGRDLDRVLPEENQFEKVCLRKRK